MIPTLHDFIGAFIAVTIVRTSWTMVTRFLLGGKKMNLNRLMKQNVVEQGNSFYAPSPRFTEENGEPLKWELRPLTNAECDALTDRHTKKRKDKRGLVIGEELDSQGFVEEMLLMSLVNPPREYFENKELQDSWSTPEKPVFTPIDVIKAMFIPGEFADLCAEVQRLCGYEMLATDEVKKEIKKNLKTKTTGNTN